MPKYLKYSPRSTEYLEYRANRQRVYGYSNWIDPYAAVHGTAPEKRVYEALSRRNIPFYFLNDTKFTIPELDLVEEFQSDFILPDYKVIIEVQGAYWHSKPSTIESDAYKFAIYQMNGYRVLAWWDYEIMGDLNGLFHRDLPGIGAFDPMKTASTELPAYSRKKQDTSKGIRTLNQKRGQRLSYKKPAVRVKSKLKRKSYGGYSINGS